MPGLFIDVKVDASVANDSKAAAKLAEVCPVDIFEPTDSGLSFNEENFDECTLCDLCSEAFPGKVQVIRLYAQD